MNEQTKSLAMQYAHKMGNSVLYNAEHMEKFAELIVKECMEVAGASYTSTPEDCVYYVDLAVNRIAEHFGVEE